VRVDHLTQLRIRRIENGSPATRVGVKQIRMLAASPVSFPAEILQVQHLVALIASFLLCLRVARLPEVHMPEGTCSKK
jgi:hypothetical protein